MLRRTLTSERWRRFLFTRPRSVTLFGLHQLVAVVLLMLQLPVLPGSSPLLPRAASGLLFDVVAFPFSVVLSLADTIAAEHPLPFAVACITSWFASPILWIAFFVAASRISRRGHPR